nr:ABC transporter ATP-binding protein [Streptomyces sp. CRN 30]
MPELVVENIKKSFHGTAVLEDVNFTVADGEFFTLLGPSGCGKSTTLSCVAGLETPDSGTIRVGDQVFFDGTPRNRVPPEGRNLGLVFQSYALWPHMTIADNLALPLKLRKVTRDERRRLIDDALAKVDMAHLRDRYPHQLSGGQQQRVALARGIVYSPGVLLLDEPLSNLDAKMRDQARVWLKDLQRGVGHVHARPPPAGGHTDRDLRDSRHSRGRRLHRPLQPPGGARRLHRERYRTGRTG